MAQVARPPKCCPPVITNPCLQVANSCELPFITPPSAETNLCFKVRLPACGNPCPPKDCCEQIETFDWSWLMWDLPAGTSEEPYYSEMGRTCTNHCCDEQKEHCCPKKKGCGGYEQKCHEDHDDPSSARGGCGGKKKR